MIIRPATADDIEPIGHLWLALQHFNAEVEPRLTPSHAAHDRFLRFLASSMADSSTAAFVATDDNQQPCGFILGQIHERPTLAVPDCGYITDLFVDPSARLAGAGRSLYQALRAWYEARGIVTLEVQIVRANPASQAFWRKMGFSDFLRTLRNDG